MNNSQSTCLECAGSAYGNQILHDKPFSKNRSFTFTPFHILWVLIFLTLLFPPIIPGSSIRVDTLLIYLIIPFLILLFGKIKFDKRCRSVVLAFSVLSCGVAVSLFLQLLILDVPYNNRYFINFQGNLRPLLFAILATVAIKNSQAALSVTKLFLIAIIIHQIFVVIDFVNLQPISGYINMLYRGDIDRGGGIRTLGLFNKVHGLAYFSLYGLLFSLCVMLQTSKASKIYYLSGTATLLSVIGLILPFSRGAWISAFVALCFLLLRINNFKFLLKILLVSFGMLALIFFMAPDIWHRFISYYDSILLGVKYLINPTGVEDVRRVGFITGRLDWGWMHAIEGWKTSPFFGDLSIGFHKFIGDGGYTERLVQHGLIGMGAQLFMFIILWQVYSGFYTNEKVKKIKKQHIRVFVIAFIFASIATGFFKERTIELLPVMLILLIMLPTKFDNIQDAPHNIRITTDA